MINSKLARRVVPALGIALSIGALASSPAAATTYPFGPWRDRTGGAVAYFNPDGDHLKVCDVKTDGEYAWVFVYDVTAGTFSYSMSDAKNDGTCRYASAADGGVFNLHEGHQYEFTVHNGNYDSDSTSHWVNA